MNIKELLRSKSGLTLIEVVVSLAILSLLAIFILSVFGTSLNTISSNANLKKSSKDAAAGIENKLAGFEEDENLSIIDSYEGSFKVDFGNIEINAEGQFITGRDKGNNSKYHTFIPD